MRYLMLSLLLSSILLLGGCDAQFAQFDSNHVYALTRGHSEGVSPAAATDDVTSVVDALFGTPDEPRWPPVVANQIPAVDPERLARAAGPFSSAKDGTHLGLFREHCVVCHGLDGGGAGPASMVQNPYPRDFRPGVFKWKSTSRGEKPTRDDLRRILARGIPGTGMPSFAILEDEDREALVDYVTYLSIRGEVERRLLRSAMSELEYDESPPEVDWRIAWEDSEPDRAVVPETTAGASMTTGQAIVQEVVERVAGEWRDADRKVVDVDEMPQLTGPELAQSIDRGKAVFGGPIANCVGCHGSAGNGNAITLDYDDWAKEYSTRIGLTPTDRDAMKPFRRAGALRPRLAEPRRLSDGVFRGGANDDELYRRITLGIDGTPMPGVAVVDQPDGRGLTRSEVFDLIRYVRYLSSGNVSL